MSFSDTFIITKEEENLRIDKLLSLRFDGKSRTYFQYLIENECVHINGKKIKKRTPVKEGDEIELFFIATEETSLTPENIPLDILFEDDHLLVINKPPGMVVHPAPGNWSKTFVNALLYHCATIPPTQDLRPGIVHRLDKDTSGILLAAKTAPAQQKLISFFQQRLVKKCYLAITVGHPLELRIDEPIARHPSRRKEMAVVEGGKEAITDIIPLNKTDKLSLILALPLTGRTHQIRVHLQHKKTPILGDETYGNPSANTSFDAKRQMLHAFTLKFPHPITEKPLEFEAPIPEDMKKILTQFPGFSPSNNLLSSIKSNLYDKIIHSET